MLNNIVCALSDNDNRTTTIFVAEIDFNNYTITEIRHYPKSQNTHELFFFFLQP